MLKHAFLAAVDSNRISCFSSFVFILFALYPGSQSNPTFKRLKLIKTNTLWSIAMDGPCSLTINPHLDKTNGVELFKTKAKTNNHKHR